MSAVASSIANDPVANGVIARIDADRHDAARTHVSDAAEVAWGRSESLDPDGVGDIADEGPGHRG